VVFALAAVALFTLLLQPICQASEFDPGDPSACCMSLDEAAPGAIPAAAVSAGSSAILSRPPTPTVRPAARPHRSAAPPDPILACLSYHSRSSRNLS